MKEFIKLVLPFRKKFTSINFSFAEKDRIIEAVLKMLNLNNINQLRDRIDGVSYYERISREIMTEIAIGKVIELNFINWQEWETKKKNKASLSVLGSNLGLICLEYGELPIIEKNLLEPHIITIRKNDRCIWICGIASPNTLKEFCDEKLLNNSEHQKNKTVFVGFNELIPLCSIVDLN